MGLISRWLGRDLGAEPMPEMEPPKLPPGSGWHYWLTERPTDASQDIELWRKGWDTPSTARLPDLPYSMNVYGLWWRPWAGATIDARSIEDILMLNRS